MRHAVFLALLLAVAPTAVFAHADAPAALDIAYTMTVMAAADGTRLTVDVTFRGNASGATEIELPSAWGGQEHLYDCIRNLAVLSQGATLADGASPSVKNVTHRPGQKLALRYEIVQDVPGVPSAGRSITYRPIVQPTYVHLIGHAAFVTPAIDASTPVHATFAWRGLPRDWSVATSYGAGSRTQRFTGLLGDLQHSIFVAGDFRLRTLSIRSKPVVVAMRGRWKFTDDDFNQLVAKVFTIEREFWNDFNYPYYVITLIPLEGSPGQYSIGGTALKNSFATFVTTNAAIEDLKHLLAHELFHNWNPESLGRLREPEQYMYWFSEGFTDYYTYELLRRSGLFTEQQYVDHYNELLRQYYLSPVRTADNERILKDFFADQDVGRLPYWRGALIAMTWDAEIRSATGGKRSLDDFMRAVRARAQSTANFEVSNESLAALARDELGRDPSPDLEHYAVKGELIAPPPAGLGPAYELVPVEIATFELGVDLDAIVKKKLITDVKVESAAYDAGLRDGQTIVRRKPIHVGDASQPVEITVQDGAAEKTITYLPRSRATISVPQYRKRT